MKKFILLLILVFCHLCWSQDGLNNFLKPSDSLNTVRFKSALITEASLVGISLIGLNQLWYADYANSKFHTINDSDEWLQMDKFGHMFSAYQLSKLGAQSFKWAGASQKQQLIYGTGLGLGFLTVVEVMDGYSAEWGFSWSDIAANTSGAGLFVGQELLWKEQRIKLKYSFHRTEFAPQRPNKLGDGLSEEFLKDYNGQTYWLSVNPHSFFKNSNLPKWLNIALGYGADGMLSGRSETLPDIKQNRSRQFYLSLDVDLERIKTESSILKTLFSVFNVVKIPFPTFEISSESGVKWHAFYF